MSTQEARAILEPAATRVRDPVSGRSMWLAGMIVDPRLEDDALKFTLQFTTDHQPADRMRMQEAIRSNIKGQGFDGEVICNVRIGKGREPAPQVRAPAERAPAERAPVRGMNAGGGMQPHGGPISKQPVEGVKHVIAVASGKGGVGKSTVATNLAVGLAKAGYRVGMMDADIYGPSLPLMMNVQGQPVANAEKKIMPLMSYGVKCMSIGFLAPAKEPIIWRGPMVMGVVRQFLHDVAWSPLDYLVVDLPPGTGDAQLTMIQATPISGAVIVTTPQEVALLDAERGVEMFRKLDVPVLGVVENMSWFSLPGGGKAFPFGEGGGVRMAAEYGVALLGQVPLETAVREGGDTGAPAVLNENIEASALFLEIAAAVAEQLPV
jgi:ATP-binding protein involved in chromosome partitioning